MIKTVKHVLVVVAALAAQTANAGPIGTTCQVDGPTFSQLEIGMTQGEAEKLIGCSGAVMSESVIAGHRTIMLGWDGRGSIGANMNALFQNDALQMKSQFGLK